jgi:hypothetical protein
VHLPEPALGGGSLRCLGGALGRRVEVDQRHVTEHEAQVGPEALTELASDRVGLPAVGALEVRVLDERDSRAGIAADVVAGRVDVRGERRARGAQRFAQRSRGFSSGVSRRSTSSRRCS